MARVYLETSFFSACVTTRRDVDSLSWRGRSLSWLKTQAPRHEVYTSLEVLDELSAPTYPNSTAALGYTIGIALLPIPNEAFQLAQLLIDQKVMPGPIKGDAMHVAIAACNHIEYLLSWNVKHLANPTSEYTLFGCSAR